MNRRGNALLPPWYSKSITVSLKSKRYRYDAENNALIKLYKSAMGQIPVSNIKTLRKRAGLRQRDIARALNVAESTVRGWESGREGVETFARVARLCSLLGCQASDLVRYVDVDDSMTTETSGSGGPLGEEK